MNSDTYVWISLRQSMAALYQESVDHHLDNAARHEATGRPDWAARSRAKAAKWQKRIDDVQSEVRRLRQDPVYLILDDHLTRVTERVLQHVEARIFHG